MSRNSCDGCKFWSEMVAEGTVGGPLKALCLNYKGPHHSEMVHRGCSKYEQGPSIDNPSIQDGAYLDSEVDNTLYESFFGDKD